MQALMPMHLESKRLTFGLLLSLTIHAMLLSLAFVGHGFSGLVLPWQDSRTEVSDLHIVLLATPVPAAEPLLTAAVKQPDDAEQKKIAASPSVPAISPFPVERPIEKMAAPPQPTKEVIALAKSDNSTWTVPPAPELPATVTAVAPPPLATDAKQDEQRQLEQVEAERQIAAQQEARLEAARVEAAQAQAVRIVAERRELAIQTAAKQAAARQEAARQDVARADSARVDAERQELAKNLATQQLARLQEAARLETTRAEAERKEAARQAIAQQETARQDAARIETARAEAARALAARIEAERQEVAKKLAASQLAARQEAARVEAARAEAERKEAAQQAIAQQQAAQKETAQREGAQQETARQAAIQIEVARLAALQAEAEKRQEKLRAIGRQLNEEAARRAATLPSVSSARRGRLFGRSDSNAELILYAETISRKIQMNTAIDTVRELAKQPHTDPMVTVSIRSDGSVESITFVVSSGVPAIDEAIRRIVYNHANYQAFPPGLVKDFDVIEIRRTWYFDMAIRLY